MTTSCQLNPNEVCYQGCDCCSLSCSHTTCSCLKRFGENYVTVTSHGGKITVLRAIDQHVAGHIMPPIFECNSMCKCGEQCINRNVQNGVAVKLLVFACRDGRGCGVRTLESIEPGQFVCEYAGEVLAPSEAKRRSSEQTSTDMNYIIAIKEHSQQSTQVTYIDPQNKGNVGRFLNHSCDPNLISIPVRVDSEILKLALFARRRIVENEELTFHYGGSDETSTARALDSNLSENCHRKVCLCKSLRCVGFLPFDEALFSHNCMT